MEFNELLQVTRRDILSLDDSHGYTTDINHIYELFYAGLERNCKSIVEIGSYLGVSTLALSYIQRFYPLLSITSVDLCDEISSEYRQNYWYKHGVNYIESKDCSTWDFINNARHNRTKYDYIFHDAQHGDIVVNEYIALSTLINEGGVLAMHDLDQISDLDGLISKINFKSYKTMTDIKGRTTGIFYK
jgi:predicted O-methyltransferase YrrM